MLLICLPYVNKLESWDNHHYCRLSNFFLNLFWSDRSFNSLHANNRRDTDFSCVKIVVCLNGKWWIVAVFFGDKQIVHNMLSCGAQCSIWRLNWKKFLESPYSKHWNHNKYKVLTWTWPVPSHQLKTFLNKIKIEKGILSFSVTITSSTSNKTKTTVNVMNKKFSFDFIPWIIKNLNHILVYN